MPWTYLYALTPLTLLCLLWANQCKSLFNHQRMPYGALPSIHAATILILPLRQHHILVQPPCLCWPSPVASLALSAPGSVSICQLAMSGSLQQPPPTACTPTQHTDLPKWLLLLRA
ncbi:hypothetical protein V8C86DRAFT_2742840 [Haematococcus lacustris]